MRCSVRKSKEEYEEYEDEDEIRYILKHGNIRSSQKKLNYRILAMSLLFLSILATIGVSFTVLVQ